MSSSTRRSSTNKATGKASAKATEKATEKASGPSRKGELAVGQVVADFSLPATGGTNWRLREARGNKLVLYFYPRDNTPGCTLEGQQFAALAPRFRQAGTVIVGISRDSIGAHEKFRDKMCFPFALLSDQDAQVCRQFDVIRAKTLYGRPYVGIERSTFLLDEAGVLRRAWRKVKVEGHAAAVLEAAKAL